LTRGTAISTQYRRSTDDQSDRTEMVNQDRAVSMLKRDKMQLPRHRPTDVR